MINLLSKEEKEHIQHVYHERLFIASGWMLFAVLFAALVLLFSIFILVRQDNANTQEVLAALEEKQDPDAQKERTEFARLRKQLFALEIQLPRPVLSEALDALLESAASPGISVTGIEYRTTEANREFVVLGTAAEREDLVTFVRALEGNPVFGDVVLPVSALAREENISFRISMAIIESELASE